MTIKQLLFFWVGVAVACAESVQVRTTPPPWFVPDDALWVCVARADFIAMGHFGQKDDVSGMRDFFVSERIKGDCSVRRFRVPFSPRLADETFEGEHIVFLVFGSSEEEEPVSDGAPAWLLSESSLSRATESLFRRVMGEVERQRQELERFDTVLKNETFPFQTEVSNLVEQMSSSPENQCESVARLLSFGPDAAPSMILALGNDTPLPTRALVLPNRNEMVVEAARSYVPETVTDALSTLIGHALGLGWETVMNGGSPDARARDCTRWKTLLFHWNENRFTDGKLPMPCGSSGSSRDTLEGSLNAPVRLTPPQVPYGTLLKLQRRAAGLEPLEP